MKVAELKANPKNPRTITEAQLESMRSAMKEFGDLSGVVRNLTTGNLVGGHQRVKILADSTIKIERNFSKPTKHGTVAEGVIEHEGERFLYREVRWPAKKELAAMLAANKHGGDWAMAGLHDLLIELDEAGSDLNLSGFQAKELERLMAVDKLAPVETPLSPDQLSALPSQVRMVQIFFNNETLPVFMERVKALQVRFKTDNITDTVFRAVDLCYSSSDANQSATSPKAARTKSEIGLSKEPKRGRQTNSSKG